MLILVALGGNALLERGERPDAAVQRRHVWRAAHALATLGVEHQLILCHGNGPQVGLLVLESESDSALSRPYPLDVLGAQTQGMIGYWIAQELHNAGVGRDVVSVLTQTVVDGSDPAFAVPTKLIGPVYSRAEADAVAARSGWAVAADGPAWRRVVASPEPVRIVEIEAIRTLVRAGHTVVCGGGGGIPVTENGLGQLMGAEAVVDKDLAAAHLALELGADRLLLLTDVAAVVEGFGTPDERPLDRVELGDVEAMVETLGLPSRTMAPKVEACRRFTQATGRPSMIGALTAAADVLAGRSGTTFWRADPT